MMDVIGINHLQPPPDNVLIRRALQAAVGLVVADQTRRAGFNVDFRTSDYATVGERRRYWDPKLTALLRQYSEAHDPAQRKQHEAEIRAESHSNVNLVLAGQFSAPMAYRSDLKG